MALNQTPNANRLHIALLGKRNSGKSTLMNALTNQSVAIASPVPGTTTDPVSKAIELHPIGPCVLIDTAGFDDLGELGSLRVEKTRAVLDKTDIAILIFADSDIAMEITWAKELDSRKIPYIPVINKCDEQKHTQELNAEIINKLSKEPLIISALERIGIDALRQALVRAVPEDFEQPSLIGHMIHPQDVVLLVMPQDIQAPKGRLILPQVQTIRDLLDHQCVVLCTTLDQMPTALRALVSPPKLIITDSQVFPAVCQKKPRESLLTSFSILFARFKGDLNAFIEGASAIDSLTEKDSVLIAEACTHTTLDGDIARIKLPNLLRKKAGEGLHIDVVSGSDFDDNLSKYKLIIHCGACMFNRKYVLSRIASARAAHVPITNYGVALAKLTGVLDYVEWD